MNESCDLETYIKLCDSIVFSRTNTHISELGRLDMLNEYHTQNLSPRDAVDLYLNEMYLFG